MSEEIKERAHAEASREFAPLPGCTTCVEAAGTIARLTRKAVEQRARACAAEAKVAYLEPHLDHVCRLHAAAEARVASLEAQLVAGGSCQCGGADACAIADRAQEAEASRDEWKWLYERMRDVVKEHRARIAELEGALREACDLLDSYEDAAACEDDVATVRLVDAFTRRARTLLTPTAPTAGAGLCSARVNSAGNLCLMPAGHAGDHYPPTERAPQVIVRTDGTGSNPTPAPKQAGEGESNWFRAFCTPCYGSGRAHSIFDTCMCEPPCEGRGVCGACGGTGRVANRKES